MIGASYTARTHRGLCIPFTRLRWRQLEVRIWASPDDYFRLKQELTRQVKYHLDEAGIGIPYPQLDVHMQNGTVDDDAAA